VAGVRSACRTKGSNKKDFFGGPFDAEGSEERVGVGGTLSTRKIFFLSTRGKSWHNPRGKKRGGKICNHPLEEEEGTILLVVKSGRQCLGSGEECKMVENKGKRCNRESAIDSCQTPKRGRREKNGMEVGQKRN